MRRLAPPRNPAAASLRRLATDQIRGVRRHADAADHRSLRKRLLRIERRARAAGLRAQADAARGLAAMPADRVIAALLVPAPQGTKARDSRPRGKSRPNAPTRRR